MRLFTLLGACVVFSTAVVHGQALGETASPLPGVAPATAPADAGEQGAIGFARYWTNEISAGRAGEVMANHLDVDALLVSICGRDYTALASEERVRAQKAMHAFSPLIFSNPALRKLMPEMRFDRFSAQRDGETVVVSYVAIMPRQMGTAANAMRVRHHQGKWMVQDLAVNGHFMSAQIAREYQNMQPHMTPADFMEAVAGEMKAVELAGAGRVTQQLRSQIEMYKRQHQDRAPDFRRYPQGDQLTRSTNAQGEKLGAGRFGPYLVTMPLNPLNGMANVAVIDEEVRGGVVLKEGQAGFVFSIKTQEILPTDRDGKTCVETRTGR